VADLSQYSPNCPDMEVMRVSIRNLALGVILLHGLSFCEFGRASAQIRLKVGAGRDIPALRALEADPGENAVTGTQYAIVRGVSPEDATLRLRGNGQLVARVGDGWWLIRSETPGLQASSHLLPLSPAGKISPELAGLLPGRDVLIEFHPDVSSGEAASLALAAGLELRMNPDLAPHHLLVRGTRRALDRFAKRPEVAYLWPASSELRAGIHTQPCASLTQPNSLIGQYVATVGEGWDGAGRGSADLKYALVRLTLRLNSDLQSEIIRRAFAEWERAASLRFSLSEAPLASRTLALQFATGNHGDAYPFDGRGRVLAHTYFPAPINSEPIAGDLHFDDDENWQAGADVDLFSVVLHEIGHALGLGHGDKPGTVMYPYYQRVNQLMPEDIAALQTLYAAPGSTTTPTPAPLSIVTATALTTTQATINLQGQVTGGTGTVQVRWTTSRGQSGAASGTRSWTVEGVALPIGTTTVQISATDSVAQTASKSISVTRTSAPTTPTTPTQPTTPTTPVVDRTAPVLTIQSPSSTLVSTRAATIAVAGIATDAVSVVEVSWSTNAGATGLAAGTTRWTATPIPLLVGDNTVMIRAKDAAGNSSWKSIQVRRLQ
jgi:hypothetical protein